MSWLNALTDDLRGVEGKTETETVGWLPFPAVKRAADRRKTRVRADTARRAY